MKNNISFLNRSSVSQIKKNGKKIIGFGAGILALKTIQYLDNPFDYFIDNSDNKVLQGWKEYTDDNVDVPIKKYIYLEKEDINDLVVIICSEHYEVMADQILQSYPDIKVYKTPLLKDFNVFSKLLKCSESILISAYGGSGGLYLLNGQSGEFNLIQSGSFRGLTQYKNFIIAANENGDILKIKTLEPFSFEYILKQKERTNTHGILYWGKHDLLFVTETLNDCISVYKMKNFNKIDEIHFSYKSKHKGGNYHHVNDICLYKDKIYASVISQSGNFYNDFLDGVILEIDYLNKQTPVPIIDNLLFPHAIKNIDNQLIFLNSFNGDILNISKDRIINLPGFIRGMDEQEGLLYIGQSRHRRLDKAKLYFNGVSMDSGIYVVDPETSMYRFLKLPEMCDVFNVKILNI